VPTRGIGPHDLKRLPDGSLIVANGGIATDPADRTKLNLDTMRASIARLDTDGRLMSLSAMPVAYFPNSIRHLALIPGGAALALQWEGDPAEVVPLLALWRGDAITLCDAPVGEATRMQGYAGSVAATADRIAITSSHGGAVQIYGIDGTFARTYARTDASGVAAQGDGFLVTDGTGALTRLTDTGIAVVKTMPLAWDNHLVALDRRI
jgi:uncharacterized protein